MGCPICLSAEATNVPRGDGAHLDCPQCGKTYVSGTSEALLRHIDPAERWKLSAWVRERQPAKFTSDELDLAKSAAVPGLMSRAERMLRALNEWFPRGQDFPAAQVYERLVAIGWNRNGGDARYMIEEVLEVELSYLNPRPNGGYRISPKGLLFLEGVHSPDLSKGFCAMWFSAEVFPLWTDVIEPAIRSAGYDPLRIDNKQHNGKIDDEIMASIRASKFVVSDFTGNRGGVYYEAGFAHGFGLPVIFMCRESDMNELHFDIRQYNCIVWSPDKLDEARERLKNRILATLGQGPLRVE